jgi:hypothetical protein
MADISIVDGAIGGQFSAPTYRVEQGDTVNFINETIRPQLLVIDADSSFVLSPKGLPGAVKTYKIEPDASTIALQLPRGQAQTWTVTPNPAIATITVYQPADRQK